MLGSPFFPTEGTLLRLLTEARPYIRGHVLDVGCGTGPYVGRLGESATRWWSCDVEVTDARLFVPDVLGDGCALPFGDASFDTVFSTEVAEHVRDPFRLFGEAVRVLKPGGYLVLSAPLLFGEHDPPRDYFRFTSFGLEHLARSHGLEILYVLPLGGVFATIAQLLSYHIPDTLRPLPRLSARLVRATVQWPLLLLDQAIPRARDALGHLLIARRPA